ncbi:proton-conducting membrane transporter [Haladaptatus halobius]|uniref:proton-conducting membrane transporter n=1 Tax=Haladaptatus halobius TaxID=2884875 RepID=UPI001D0B8C05|nr:proton-conducting membrane transporter [Haladaptatus halobius]
MTSRPRMRDPAKMLPGIVALVLFVVLAVVFLGASFGAPQGFPNGANITASIGYAMFNIFNVGGENIVQSEGFLIVFEIIDLVLVAALAAAVMLARREDVGITESIRTDGGREEGGDDE